MKQSKELTEFYKEIYAWAKEGCPKHAVFTEATGLCHNSILYSDKYKVEIYQEIVAQFNGVEYPFGGMEEYDEQYYNKSLYKCPKRLAWLAHHIDVQHTDEETE